jgi:hypothetical protein
MPGNFLLSCDEDGCTDTLDIKSVLDEKVVRKD